MADVQEKYNRILSLMLEKVGEPLEKSEAVIKRICNLLEATPPAAPEVHASEKTELIVSTLANAEHLAKSLEILEKAIDEYLDPHTKNLVNELEDLSAFTTSLMPTASTVPSKNLSSLLDNITAGVGGGEGDYVVAPSHTDAPTQDFTKGMRNFFYEDKVYVGPGGERKVLRTQATHDFVPTINPNDLMGPRRPGSKINYDDFAIEDTRRTKPQNFSFGVATEPEKPLAVTPTVKPVPGPAAPAAALGPRPTQGGQQGQQPAKPAPTPAPTPTPAAGGGGGGDDEGPIDIVIPKWTKGPPSTNEEIAEYKAFMVAKYEAEAKLNAEILRRKKLKEGK